MLSADEIARLRQRPSWRPAVQSAGNVALYAALAYVAARADLGPARFIVWPVMGFVLAGFYAAVHDCWHNNFLDGVRANRIAGAAWSTVVLKNYTAGKLSHFVHHRYTRTAGDNEPRFVFRSVPQYLRAVFHLGMIRTVRMSLAAAVGRLPATVDSPTKGRAVRSDGIAVSCWFALALIVTVASPMLMLCVYWGPMIFFSPMVVAIALPEHHACRDDTDIYGSTRTTSSNWLVRQLIWNSNYHAEHHLYPSLPSSSLPRVHRLVRDSLEHQSSGYLSFHAGLLRDICVQQHRGTTTSRSPATATRRTES